MSEDYVVVTRTCRDCGFPIHAPRDAPCPYCTGAHPAGGLHDALYDMPLVSLQRLRSALRAIDGAATVGAITVAAAPISDTLATWIDRHDDAESASIRTTVSTVVDVLLTLYLISEEPAPPEQLNEVIVNVTGGHLDQLPLRGRGPCFCSSGQRYKRCHGRRTRN